MNLKFRRLFALVFDYLLCLYIIVPISWIFDLDYNIMFLLLVFIIILCKDLICKNGSIGKEIFKLKIIDDNNHLPSKKVLYFRNLTAFIWIIEAILILLFNKRIGDFIFKTNVVSKNMEVVK